MPPKCQRCKCRTKRGVRCKLRTCKNLPCCHHHINTAPIVDARLRMGLFVKKSGIRGAGYGLFTRNRIPKNAIIGQYTGHRVRADSHGHYVLQCGRGRQAQTVDAVNMDAINSSALRYANTARGSGRVNNARIAGPVSGHVGGCNIRASRNIPANREILLAYGPGYRLPAPIHSRKRT